MKTGVEREQAANQYTLRLGGVIDLASSIECDQFYRPDGIHEDFIDDIAGGWNPRFSGSVKPLFDAFDGVDWDYVQDDEISYYFHRKGLLGYVAKFETPIYTHASENSKTFSWGYYTSNWFYGDTIEECWVHAVAWAEKHIEEAKSKFSK